MITPRLSLKACHKITVFIPVLLCRARGCNIFPSATLLLLRRRLPRRAGGLGRTGSDCVFAGGGVGTAGVLICPKPSAAFQNSHSRSLLSARGGGRTGLLPGGLRVIFPRLFPHWRGLGAASGLPTRGQRWPGCLSPPPEAEPGYEPLASPEASPRG